MAGVESKLRSKSLPDADASDQLLLSACSVAALEASTSKQRVDALLAKHSRQIFPQLTVSMAADSKLVLLLLDAPNVLTTTALAKVFPELLTPALAARVCIPQCDPAHYAAMVTEGHGLHNVRFQRLDTWLAANAGGDLRVPICFADYETSVYGRRSMQLSPLQDLQRFLRYGYAADTCLLGVTLSYRSLHKDHYPADGPVLTEEDVAGFVKHEAECVGMKSEPLECFRYGMVLRARPSPPLCRAFSHPPSTT